MNNESQNRGAKLARGGTWLAVGSYSESVGLIVLLIVAARLLPIADIGVISFLLMLIALSVTIASFALPYVAIHMIAKERGRINLSSANSVFRDVTLLSLAFGTISLTLVVLAADGFTLLPLMPAQASVIRLAGFDILPSVLIQVLAGSLLGAERFKKVGLAATLGAITRTGLAVIFLFMGHGIFGVLAAWFVGDFIWCVILSVYAVQEFSGTRKRTIQLTEFVSFGGPLYVSNIVEYLHQNIDRFLLLIILGTEVLGLYTPVIASVTMLLILSSSLVRPLLSRVSAISMSSSSHLITELAQKAIRWISFVFIPIGFLLAIESSGFLVLVAGQGYLSAAPSLSLLSLFIAISSQYYVLRAVLIGIGRSRELLIANSIAILANIYTLIILAEPLGLMGVAISRAFLFIFQLIVSYILLNKIRGVRISMSVTSDALIASTAMAIGVITFKILFGNTLNIAFSILIGGLIYLAALRLISPFKYEDFQFIRMYVPEFLEPIVNLLESMFLTDSENKKS